MHDKTMTQELQPGLPKAGVALPMQAKAAGFTLLEVLLAVGIAAMLITAVLQVFEATILAREEVKALSEPMSKGPQILDMIEEDLRAIWTYDIKDNRVFRGEDRDIVGLDADRIHLLVAGRTVFPVRLDDDSLRTAPYAEVSYILRSNDDNPNLLELWRREDALFDKELWRGGNYLLLSDRVRSFDVTYYDELGDEAEPEEDWDSAEKKTLPRRIKIELELERSAESFGALVEVDDIGGRTEKYTRHVVFDADRVNILNEGIALIPVVPAEAPSAEGSQGAAGAARQRGANRGGQAANKRGTQGQQRGSRRGKNGSTNSQIPIPGLGGTGAGRGGLGGLDRILRGGAGGNNAGRGLGGAGRGR